MTQRVTQHSVTFLHPFALSGSDDPIAPGTYVIESLEEAIESASFIGYRRLSTTMTVASKSFGRAVRQMIEIDPAELEAALVRDQEKQPVSRRGAADANAAAVSTGDQ